MLNNFSQYIYPPPNKHQPIYIDLMLGSFLSNELLCESSYFYVELEPSAKMCNTCQKYFGSYVKNMYTSI